MLESAVAIREVSDQATNDAGELLPSKLVGDGNLIQSIVGIKTSPDNNAPQIHVLSI